MDRKIPVLGGYVCLVDHMGDDSSIVRAARVSYQNDYKTGEDKERDQKLIWYLMKHDHTSPFEAVTFTFEVEAPIFVLRQWMRHRTWSYNEISGRYTKLPETFYVPLPKDITTQDTKNKQNRTDIPLGNAEELSNLIRQACTQAFSTYEVLLLNGCPRELARMVLPLATYSRMYATVDLHNLFHFIKLRFSELAQKEIRVYAEALLHLIEPIVPVAVEAFKELKLKQKGA